MSAANVRCFCVCLIALHNARDSKVEHLSGEHGIQENVLGLDVADSGLSADCSRPGGTSQALELLFANFWVGKSVLVGLS